MLKLSVLKIVLQDYAGNDLVEREKIFNKLKSLT